MSEKGKGVSEKVYFPKQVLSKNLESLFNEMAK
jgi:hypothetical protein